LVQSKKEERHRDVSLDQVCKDKACDDVLYIQRNSLIRLNCKHENKTSTVEYYRVLAFFSKHHNKWFPDTKDKFIWDTNPTRRANIRVLARMMKESGTSYREVVLEAGEVLGPQQVYCIKNFKDILQVENELVDYDV
jgi:hypothetical protein